MNQVADRAGRLTCTGRCETLLDDDLGFAGRLLQVLGQHVCRDHLDDGPHFGIIQLGFCLRLELRVGHLDADHRCQALPHIITRQVAVLFLEQICFAGVVIQRAGERTAEAGDVHTAIGGVDAVGKGKLGGGPAIIVLYCQFDLHIVDHTLGTDRPSLQTASVLVEVAYKRNQATLEGEGCFTVAAFVAQGNRHTPVEIGHFAETLRQDVEVEVACLHDRGTTRRGH